jgi:hypothetical protein
VCAKTRGQDNEASALYLLGASQSLPSSNR